MRVLAALTLTVLGSIYVAAVSIAFYRGTDPFGNTGWASVATGWGCLGLALAVAAAVVWFISAWFD